MGNNNSSRYGVVTQLQFDDGDIPKMVGSLNRTYLLEKSRVVSRSSRERNFHVFYQMVGSDDEEFKSSMQLSGATLCLLLRSFPGRQRVISWLAAETGMLVFPVYFPTLFQPCSVCSISVV